MTDAGIVARAAMPAPVARVPRNAPWPVERVERLKLLVAEKLTASEIAAALGGVTRNAVIGKCGRIGLQLHEPSERGITRARRVNGATPYKAATPAGAPHIIEPIAPPTSRVRVADNGRRLMQVFDQGPPGSANEPLLGSRLLTLAELDMVKHCRFPIGDPRSAAFRYCAADREHPWPAAPHCYCAAHGRLMRGG